ncbi:MAG: diguanylate cyclase [Deferrisomatales bacterium]
MAPAAGDLAGGEDRDPLGLMGRRDFSLLIVDDSSALRQELRSLVEGLDYIGPCREAANGVEAYRKVLEAPPDLVLCDLEMPSVDGLKFLSLVRSRPEARDIPVILVTGRAEVETKIRGLELGASDYVTKPFDAGELAARIKVQLKIKALQDALRRSNEKLQELSSVDPLTRLYNRRYFMEALAAEFSRSDRYATPLSFVMVDIDHFKRLNDTYGHQAGDDVLREMGALIRRQIRAADTPGRYGGEEFCILLPQTAVEGAREFAQRLRVAVEAASFPAQGRELRLTASLGVSSCPSEGVESGEDLIRRADEALYEAKETGRNRVVVREP